MRLRSLVRKLKFGLAGLVGGFAFACSGPTSPGEMPPMAPRPEPMQPAPAKSPVPLPNARDAIPDAGTPPVTEVPSPKLEGSHETVPMQQTPPGDAGVQDAVALPPQVPDAMPLDANRQPEAVSFPCC